MVVEKSGNAGLRVSLWGFCGFDARGTINSQPARELNRQGMKPASGCGVAQQMRGWKEKKLKFWTSKEERVLASPH